MTFNQTNHNVGGNVNNEIIPDGWFERGGIVHLRGLTTEELLVLVCLKDAWNLAIKLPLLHSDDIEEISRAIHAAQNVILARPAVEWSLSQKEI